MDQKNSEYGKFSRSELHSAKLKLRIQIKVQILLAAYHVGGENL